MIHYCLFCKKELKEIREGSLKYFCNEECRDNYDLIEEKTAYYTKNIVCPYCGYEDMDSWEMREDYDEEYSCPECDEIFTVGRDIEVSYTSTPHIDVLKKLKEEKLIEEKED